MAFGADGLLYVANYADNTIWRFDSSGNGTIFAGIHNDFTQGLSGPTGLAFDNTGTTLYVANHVSMASAYTICSYSTAGGGLHTGTQFATTGYGSSTGLNKPNGLAIRGSDLYVANGGNDTILKFALPGGGGAPTTFATVGVHQPFGLAFDNAGNRYAANQSSFNIEEFSSGGSDLGVFASGLDHVPAGLAFDSTGTTLYEAENTLIIRSITNGVVSLFAFDSGLVEPQFIAIKPDCAPAVMSIAQYAGITVTGSVGCTYRIDYTTDNNNPVWTPLTTVTLTSPSYLYLDTTLPAGSRFYRAVVQ
jgi:sugar lactone lactonase YvrE